ncbi:heterokaryon incompatibility protein-domain-containing protein [Xylaria acuta]|nr:heterokaryon incompatibility protein-domain-containing protein [Xylaria acuta]
MDVQDDRFDFGLAIVNAVAPILEHAGALYLADCGTATQTRHVLLVAYVLFIFYNIRTDVGWSIIRSLSLVLLWFCFYGNRDFSLMSLYGTSGVQLDTHSIVLGNIKQATYFLSWAILIIARWTIKYYTRPFQRLPAYRQAIMTTTVVQIIVIGIDEKTCSSTGRARRYYSLDNEQPVSDSQVDGNTASMYAQGGELASGKIFRLIKVLPRTNGSEMSCEIVNADLEKLVRGYEAISYTWGDTKEQTIIQVDGRPIRISQKVLEILHALRYDWEPRMLWIDLICINQCHTTEKSHQVTMVRHTYYRASSVILWLDPLPDTAVAIDLLVEISRSPGLTGVQGAHLHGQRRQQHRLLALVRFIENGYFNRLWIKVLCGDRSTQWEDLSLVIKFLGNPEMLRSLQGFSYSLAFLLSNYRSMKCKDPRDKVFGLLGLVRVYKDTTEYIFTVEGTSRKLIALAFAGVGHFRRLQELPSWVPDWASNARIKRIEGGNEAGVEDLPTPKQSSFSYHLQSWRAFGNGFDIMKPNQSSFESTDLALGYRAVLDSKAEVKLIEDDVLGIRVLAWFEEAEALAVNVPSPYPTNQNIEDILWRTLIGHRLAASDLRRTCSFMSMGTVIEMRDIWHEVFTQIIGGDSMFKTVVAVLCGRSGHPHVWELVTTGTKFANDDVPRPELPGTEGDSQSWEERLEELCEKEEIKHLFEGLVGLIAAVSPEQSSNRVGASETDMSQQIADAVSLAPMISQFSEGLRISFERRLCVTKNGYMGLVPPLTRVGDLVSIFYGGEAPFLVRLETNPVVAEKIGVLRCQLVGKCYMHGLMDGKRVVPGNTPLWFHPT